MKRIVSRENPLFKHLRLLTDDPRYRREEKATIADGEHLVQAALEADWPIRRVVIRSEDARSATLELVDEAEHRGIEVLDLGAALFDRVSPVTTPSGILCEIGTTSSSLNKTDQGDVLALAGVQDAGNLGALMRSALAAGICNVWCDAKCAQSWSPKALRSGMGAHFRLNIVDACDLDGVLRQDARQSLVTCLEGETTSLYDLDLLSPNIWVFGSEGQGVPPEIRTLATRRVRIPMAGAIESLNVGAAAAVCFFEQLRQRLQH